MIKLTAEMLERSEQACARSIMAFKDIFPNGSFLTKADVKKWRDGGLMCPNMACVVLLREHVKDAIFKRRDRLVFDGKIRDDADYLYAECAKAWRRGDINPRMLP